MKKLDKPWQLVTIDPGVKYTAIAIWLGKRMHFVDYIENSPKLGYDIEAITGGAQVSKLVIESQYIGRGRKSIVDLAYWTGAAALSCNAEVIKRVKPRQWKGTSPKNLKCCQIYKKLNVEEKFRVRQSILSFTKKPLPVLIKKLEDNPKKDYGKGTHAGKLTDVLDAIGIGLWELKR